MADGRAASPRPAQRAARTGRPRPTRRPVPRRRQERAQGRGDRPSLGEGQVHGRPLRLPGRSPGASSGARTRTRASRASTRRRRSRFRAFTRSSRTRTFPASSSRRRDRTAPSRRRTTRSSSTASMRFVGDRVAVVAAETPLLAEKACDLIEVEYEVLPAVLDPAQGDGPGRAEAPSRARQDRHRGRVAQPRGPRGGVGRRRRARPPRGRPRVRARIPRAVRSGHAHRSARDALVSRPRRPARHRDEHAGPVPRAPHRGAPLRTPHLARARHQAAHRRRVRREAGDRARGRLRGAHACDPPPRQDDARPRRRSCSRRGRATPRRSASERA